MRQFAGTCVLSLVAGVAFGVVGIAQAADVTPAFKDVVAAANKEGELLVTWSASTLGGPDGAKTFEDRMGKLYGSTVKIKWSPGRNMPEVGSDIAMRYANGLPSPTDVYYGFSYNMKEFLKYDMFASAPWQDYAPDRFVPGITEYDNTFVKVQTAYTGFAVSKKFAPYIPTSLNDLIKPEWKGKLATNSTAAGFEMLSAVWGADRTLDWAKKFAPQVSGLLRCSDTDRLLSGEYAALVTDCGGTSTMEAIADGAPLVHVIPPEMNVVSFFYLSVPKNAVHPNAAKMLITYLLSAEGQQKLGGMRGGMDLDLLPGSKSGDRIHKLEAEWGKKFVNADIAWQLGNEEGDKTKRIIKDIIMQNK
jgi:ABC-type Fe3+ transport system substrate-binding protein